MARILDYPESNNSSTKKTGWRRMAEIAEQSMEDNNYTIDDVRKELKDIREQY